MLHTAFLIYISMGCLCGAIHAAASFAMWKTNGTQQDEEQSFWAGLLLALLLSPIYIWIFCAGVKAGLAEVMKEAKDEDR